MERKQSKYITGLRKTHRTQHSLITMLEKRKSALDKGEKVSVLFMFFSNVFDTVSHDLLLAKLKGYGFSKNVLELMCSYLENPRQLFQFNNNFSLSKKIHAGVPEGSI